MLPMSHVVMALARTPGSQPFSCCFGGGLDRVITEGKWGDGEGKLTKSI